MPGSAVLCLHLSSEFPFLINGIAATTNLWEKTMGSGRKSKIARSIGAEEENSEANENWVALMRPYFTPSASIACVN